MLDDISAMTRIARAIAAFEADQTEDIFAAEPRKGKWIDGNEGKWNAVFCPKCSVCGTPFYGIETVRYHYCPNCGARMEDSDETDRC